MKVERSKNPALFFSKKEKERIVKAIQNAEMCTSSEIRVHLERKARDHFYEHAKEIFKKIGMDNTHEKNGVMIMLGLASRRFAILGGEGINSKVRAGFWDDVANHMGAAFKEDRFADGIVEAVSRVGQKLQEHFPYRRNDVNELPDEISYSI